MITSAVGASRLYLGVQWFTDVAAGLALGGAIVAIVAVVTLLLPPGATVGTSTGPRPPASQHVKPRG